MREPSVANSGAPMQVASAKTDTSCPALAAPNPKSAAMSFNMPVTIIAPVPMMKLPTQSVTSLGSMPALGRGECARAPVVVGAAAKAIAAGG
ncbi:hypothetical protein D3C72_1709510 [compost metagenome]